MLITIAYTVFIIMLGLRTNMNDKKARTRYLIISGIILVLISGLRSYNLGSGDTSRYAITFQEDVMTSFQNLWDSGMKDPFYHVFSKALSFVVGNNFSALLTIFAAIFIGAYSILVQKESPNLLLSFIVFFSMGFFNFSMNGVRQGLAMAFIMLAFIPLKEKKLLWFIILVFVATLFHNSAVIFLLALPFCKVGFSKGKAILYLGLIAILMIYGDSLIRGIASEAATFDERFEGYVETTKTLTYAGFVQLMLYFLLVLMNLRRFFQQDPDASMLTTLLILAMIFQVFAVFIAEMFRVAMYFSSFLVILVPRLLQTYPPSNRKMVTFILCALLLSYFYLIPYKLEYDFFWND